MTKEHSEQPKDLRIRSKVISEGVSRTPNRAYLRALGFEDEDFQEMLGGKGSIVNLDEIDEKYLID